MVKHVWSVLCERSIIDKDSNNISLLNVLEQLTVVPPPSKKESDEEKRYGVMPIKYEIVSLWARERTSDPALGRERIMMIDPIGKRTKLSEIDVDLRSFERLRTRQRFAALPIGVDGKHVFSVQLKDERSQDWATVANIPLQIIIKQRNSK